jgi:dTDP-glucose 4,6-dehydratase
MRKVLAAAGLRKRMKLFVTGGAGFIGSNLIRYLLSLGDEYSIVNYDKLTYAGNLSNLNGVATAPHYCFMRGDICDAALLRDGMQGCDAVVHLAAESHVDRSIYNPCGVVDSNVRGTFVLLEAARERRIQKFVHVSTDEVYGDMASGQVAAENSRLQPNSPYSASKASSDLLVRAFFRTYGFPAVITRSSNNYGPYQFPEKFVPLVISNALENKPVPIYGDGFQERDWLHVEDHCRALLAVLKRGREGHIYNIGGGDVEKNLIMARRILKLLGAPESLIQHVADRPGHDRRYAMDCSKIWSELGWQPSIPLEDGIRRTIAWYQNNTSWLTAVRQGDYLEYYDKFYLNRDITLSALIRPRADKLESISETPDRSTRKLLHKN